MDRRFRIGLGYGLSLDVMSSSPPRCRARGAPLVLTQPSDANTLRRKFGHVAERANRREHFLTRALALHDVSHQGWEATSGHPLGREDLS